MKIMAAAGIGAIVLATTGVALAAASGAPKTAKACVGARSALKLEQGGRCTGGSKAITLLGKGGPGTALGYAHILPSSNQLDPSHSYNVAAANVKSTIAGFTCFKGLKFTPHFAVVTLDYNGILNGQIPQATLKLPANPSDCGLSSAQAEVFTGLVTSSSFTSGAKIGFYIVFY